MPVTEPAASALKRTPSSTALGSAAAAVVGVADAPKTSHGHVAATAAAPVVNDQVLFAARALPAASLARGSVAPPWTVRVYTAWLASAVAGVRIAERVPAS